MTTSSTSAPSIPLSRSEWVSTLPPWRRLLAMVNWRPVYDIEQREPRARGVRSVESEIEQQREQTARRARIQNGCLAAQCRFLLADTSRNRLQLSEAVAVLLEEITPPIA